MFTLFYNALTFSFYILSLPFLPLLALNPKYRHSLPARFFLWKNPPFPKRKIHFHACSFGEVKALAPLVEHFKEANISVITQTGFKAAKEYEKEVRYLPFEPLLWWWLRPQKALVVLEAELWYLLFFLSKKRGAKIFLVNARISQKSYPKYLRFRWFYKRVFAFVDGVYAQSKEDKKRLEVLGAKNIEVIGNIKLLSLPKPTKKITKNRSLIVAASTHDPEEEIIVTAWLAARKDETLLVAPRHPERFDEVDELLGAIAKREGLSYHRWSQKQNLDSDIVLLDTLGELVNFYAIADLVILGGSFVAVGGHNPLEVAQFGIPLISGKYIFNQQESFSYVKNAQLIEAKDLQKILEKRDLPKTKLDGKVNIKPLLQRLESVV